MLKLKLGAAVLCALALAGCGGGGSLGSGETTGGTTGETPVPTIASLVLLRSSPQLSSDAATSANGVTLTAIAKDGNNNLLADQAVTFSADSGALQVVAATTDVTGTASAVLSTGGDPTNRTISVTARSGGLSQTTTVDVVGTSLSVSGLDSTQFNVATNYTATLTDASGAGIAGIPVLVETDPENTLSARTLTTNGAGQVTVTLTAAKANSTLTFSALGVTTTKSITVSADQFTIISPNTAGKEVNIGTSQELRVRWLRNGAPVADNTLVRFAVTRGTLSPAATGLTVNGEASVRISSTEAGPSTIVVSSDAFSKPTITGSLEFVATTPASIDVQASPARIATNESSEITVIVRDPNNNLVKNATVDFTLSDGTTGNISAPSAVTNSQGIAKVTFNATSQSSATRSVTVSARVRGTSITDSAAITVGSRAVGVTIGFGSQIIAKDEATYQLPFTVIVTDSAGNPVPDARFTLSAVPVAFRKGTFASTSVICPNEDVNLNDIADPSEDADNDGVLEPGRVATVPSTVTLDADGSGRFLLTYPKDRGQFVQVRVIGVATVAGTETTAIRTLWLSIAEGDEDNLPGVSPYGVIGSCASPD